MLLCELVCFLLVVFVTDVLCVFKVLLVGFACGFLVLHFGLLVFVGAVDSLVCFGG